ncbi:unnamed protein product [Macrosiphum euphorbiae]|uniref:Transposable element P transposase n=2 Tax=Macrosiphum euphorbiae TaxID=13131 RepID=A0AAV0X7Q9_9HEMI|nr:unnamed protein product [Macrosiphum euphorbiae]
MLPRITDQHVVPEKISKMKVKCATQIFSQRVSSTMMFLSSKNLIDPSANDTAKICLFFDKLFDSLNGSFDGVIDGKIYRTSIKKNSPHHALWAERLQVLSTMKFVNKNGKTCVVPTIENWMKTIRGFQKLFKTLYNYGIRSLLPRHVNQDSVECFFGAARSVSSSDPSCHAFASAYKTLLLNNLMSFNSPGSNCEDIVEASLTSYRNLIIKDPNDMNVVQNNCNITVDLPVTIFNVPMGINILRENVHTYIAGYILKKTKQKLI